MDGGGGGGLELSLVTPFGKRFVRSGDGVGRGRGGGRLELNITHTNKTCWSLI